MATYTGRSKRPGSAVHLLVGGGHYRHSLCGVTVSTGARSWVFTTLRSEGVKENSPVAPFQPVTCKQCVKVLMGRAWEAWNWEVIEE